MKKFTGASRGAVMRVLSMGCALAVAMVACPPPANADSVATLLGNYSISQLVRIDVERNQIRLHLVLDMAAIPALKTLHLADSNADGSTSSEERDTYLRGLIPEYQHGLEVSLDGQPLTTRFIRMATTLPPEQGGFSLRVDVDFVADLPPTEAVSSHQLAVRNRNFAEQFGWHEIVLVAGEGITISDTDAFSTSATNNLNTNPQAMPAAGPLDERSITATFGNGHGNAAGSHALQPRPGFPPGSPLAGDPDNADAKIINAANAPDTRNFLTRTTDRVVALISAPQVSASTLLVALLVALALGAFHALSPGHGKTVVGAYLIGSRGTPRHAVFLGVTVTITHTLGVFLLGFVTLFASRYFVAERVFPILTFVSGALVVGIGGTLLFQRARQLWFEKTGRQQFIVPSSDMRAFAISPVLTMRQSHDGDRANPALMHSHGGVMHSHLPPGADGESISWRSLLSLGISGGLLPCPSALVLLLAAVALHRTGYGLVLVLAFSVGLAMTLTAIGMTFLYAKHLLRGPSGGHPLLRYLPLASAAVITVLGCGICVGAFSGTF